MGLRPRVASRPAPPMQALLFLTLSLLAQRAPSAVGAPDLRVRVIDECGQPVAAGEALSVAFLWPSKGRLAWCHGTPEEAGGGVYRIPLASAELEPACEGGVLVLDAEQRAGFVPARAEAREIEVHLRPPVAFDLAVRGPGGEPLERALVSFHPRLLGMRSEDSLTFRHGVTDWRIPDLPTRIEIDAGPRFPPFAREIERPAELPSSWILEIPAHPVLAGLVTSEAEPVPGVDVRLWPEPPPAITPRDRLEGRERPVRPAPIQATTDRDGRFALPLPRGGTFRLQAYSHAYDGVVELPLSLRDGEARDDLRLALEPRLASIRGTVLAPERLEDARVELRGPLSSHVSVRADGRFEARGLLPGDWRLAVHARRADPAPFGLGGELTWPVHVEAGETAEVTLLLGEEPFGLWTGRLRVDGAPVVPLPSRSHAPARSRACLESVGSYANEGLLSGSPLAADGTFRLAATGPGEALLALVVEAQDGIDWEVLEPLALTPGRHAWELDVRTGSLRVLPAPGDAEAPRDLRFLGQEPDGRRVLVHWSTREDDGSLLFERVPAGVGAVLAGPQASSLATVRIEAGTTSTLVLR